MCGESLLEIQAHKKKPKSAVGYEHPADGVDRCADCKYFIRNGPQANVACRKVEGVILPADWCRLFQRKK